MSFGALIATTSLAAVDWSALGQSSLAALVAGTGVTLCFSLAIYGAARSADARRSGQPGLASAATAIMILGASASLAAVVAALYLMLEG